MTMKKIRALHARFSSSPAISNLRIFLPDHTFTNFSAVSFSISPTNHINLHYIKSFLRSAFYSVSPAQPAQEIFASSTISNKPSIQDFLRKSCGLSQKQAILALKPLVHAKSTQNLEQVLQLFKERGFSDVHIQKIVSRRPQVLASSVQNTLQPKLNVFEHLGIVGDQLGDFISKGPALLSMSLERKIAPGISFLEKMLESNEKVVTVLMREPRILFVNLEKKLESNLLFLQNHGISGKILWSFMIRKPRFFLSSQATIKDVVKTVEKLGVSRRSGMFPHALFVVSSMNKKTLERKIKFLITLGLSKEEVLLIFRKSPFILAASEKKLQCHMDFLVNTLKCVPSIIVSYPQIFTTSMEARIMPRYRVLQMLQSMQLPKESFSIMNMFSATEKRFLEKFVFKYGESSGLYEIYKGLDGTMTSPRIMVEEGKS
eukprot:Gb_12966 [translate_table: standard]